MNYVATQVGNGLISSPCIAVSKESLSSSGLVDTLNRMRKVNNEMGGIGISANQIGANLQISIVHIRPTEARPDQKDEGEFVFINPKIVNQSESTVYEWEGCLSVAEAGLFAKVSRPESIEVEWLDDSGKAKKQMFEGMMARVVQHELAHLEGRIFMQESGVDLGTLHSRSEYVAKKQNGDLK